MRSEYRHSSTLVDEVMSVPGWTVEDAKHRLSRVKEMNRIWALNGSIMMEDIDEVKIGLTTTRRHLSISKICRCSGILGHSIWWLGEREIGMLILSVLRIVYDQTNGSVEWVCR